MEDSRRDLKDDNLNSLLPDVQVDRRGFIAGCIAAGFAVSASPVLAQAIKTPMDGLEGGDGKIGDMPIYHAVPQKGGKRPVVIVIPEIWGLHEYQKDICRRLAKAAILPCPSIRSSAAVTCQRSRTSRRFSPGRIALATSRRSPISIRSWLGRKSTNARTPAS
jgi:hypothetical protein